MPKLKNTCCFSIPVLLLLALCMKGYGHQPTKEHGPGQVKEGSLLTSGYVPGANLLTGEASILAPFLNPSPQEELFVWVRIAEEAKYFAEG